MNTRNDCKYMPMILRTLWNLLLVLVAAYWTWIVAPLVVHQFDDISWGSPSFAWRVIATAFEGAAFLMVVLIALLSIGTWSWGKFSIRWRWLYGCAGGLFFAVVAGAAAIDYWDMGRVTFWHNGDMTAAAFWYCIAAAPILVGGTSYPRLIAHLWRRLRGLRTERSDDRHAVPVLPWLPTAQWVALGIVPIVVTGVLCIQRIQMLRAESAAVRAKVTERERREFAEMLQSPLGIGAAAYRVRDERPRKNSKSKIGGTPVGLLPELWPKCQQCGKSMEFLAQLDLQRLTISSKYACAYLFACHGYLDYPNGKQCESYDGASGANRVVLIASLQIQEDPPYLGVARLPEFSLLFHRIKTRAEEEQEQVERDAFIAEQAQRGLASGQETITIALPSAPAPMPMRIGGEPDWLQSDETPTCPACHGPMRFIVQLDSEIRDRIADKYVSLPFSGAAYAFVCQKECSPDGTFMLWQE